LGSLNAYVELTIIATGFSGYKRDRKHFNMVMCHDFMSKW